jgi:phage/plasmid-like protein (TIGR03299 family)
MAHNLNQKTDGSYSFVAVGEKAWHGLGTYVNQAMTAEQAIELGGLNYEVEKKPVMVCDGKEIPDYYATVRTDTNDVLGLVTDSYEVIQNNEAFSFFDSIVERGEAIYQTAGALGKGEKIFITAKLPEDILVHGEQIENYLLLTSGHDGKNAIQAGFTSTRVVCQNTLNAALRGLQNKVTIMHFKNAKSKLEAAARVMGIASKYVIGLNNAFNKMADVKITDEQLRKYVETILKPRNETINKETLEAEYSTRFVNTVDDVMNFAHGHHTQLTEATKGTVWGAYNAISGYYNYIKEYKSQEQKMNDVCFKLGAKKIESAFDLALQLM